MIDFFKTAQFSKFSPRKSVDEAMKNDPAASQDPWRALIAEKVIPFAKAEPIYPYDVSLAVSTAIESAMKGMDTEKALAKAEKDINDFIAKSKLAGTNPKQVSNSLTGGGPGRPDAPDHDSDPLTTVVRGNVQKKFPPR